MQLMTRDTRSHAQLFYSAQLSVRYRIFTIALERFTKVHAPMSPSFDALSRKERK
jgi:hypothetical protein